MRTPPTNGTRIYGGWSFSQRDADGDGLDNTLDTCALVANSGADSDGDGIDNACDTNPPGGTSTDDDGDGFANRQDNCPVTANGGALQRSSEHEQPHILAAPDGGPKSDAIGDACDTNPLTSNNEGAFIESQNFIPKCIGTGGDGDGDHYCAAQDIDDTSAGVGGFSLNNGIDQDGVNLDRGDGFASNAELYVGTDPLRACASTATAGDETVDAAPNDFNDNRAVNVTDVLALKPSFNISVPPASPRFDIVPSKAVNISDILAMKPAFNTSCSP
jgi:hypothetical protein